MMNIARAAFGFLLDRQIPAEKPFFLPSPAISGRSAAISCRFPCPGQKTKSASATRIQHRTCWLYLHRGNRERLGLLQVEYPEESEAWIEPRANGQHWVKRPVSCPFRNEY